MGSMPPRRSETGDVKYHLGSSRNALLVTDAGSTHAVPNPSHLEVVNPVLEGLAPRQATRVRSRVWRPRPCASVLPILVHGMLLSR